MFQDFTDEVDEDPIYAFGSLVPDIAMMVFGTKGLEKVVKGVEATRSLEGIDELGAGGKVAKGVEGADGAGSVGSRLAIIDGKVGGKIPLKEYQELRLSSVMKPDSDTLTLGKYANDTSSYTVRAGDTEYFDMGSGWNRVMVEYDLNYDEMFDYFNKPVLDEAIASGQTIRFSHDPRVYETGSLFDEWNYIKSTTGITDANLMLDGGFWVVK